MRKQLFVLGSSITVTMARIQFASDWTRVTVDDHGFIVVHKSK